MTERPKNLLIAQTVLKDYGDHLALTVTTFRANKSVINIWKPSIFARVNVDSEHRHFINFENAKGVVAKDTFGDHAQAVLDAINAGESKSFYFDGTIINDDD